MITKEMLSKSATHLSLHIKANEDPQCDQACPTSPHHLLWMCKQIDCLDDTKAALWAGYIHGVMVMSQMLTIEEEQKFFWDYDKS